jgi:CheY-like chemotaxis protein
MLNVLVLEDQPAWEALLVNAVRNGHLPECRIHRASTYGEALRLIHEEPLDVAVLDYVIERAGPEGPKTGLDVAAEMRAVAPGATILLVTLVDPERVQARCEQLGVRLVEKGSAELEGDVIREITHGLRNSAQRGR